MRLLSYGYLTKKIHSMGIRLLLGVLGWGMLTMGHAQSAYITAAKKKIFRAYITYNTGMWQEGMADLQKIYHSNPSMEVAYEQVLARYGLIGFCLADDNCSDVQQQLDEAINKAKALLKEKEDWSEAHAVLGGLYGLKVGVSPAKALFLGPRSANHISRGTEENPNNPAAWVERGNMKYHAPRIFGGSKKEAIECFTKAVQLYDQQPQRRQYSWMYLHAMAWLGKAYEDTKQTDKALAIYRKALAFEPEFSWVRDHLLPELEVRLK